MLAAQTAQAALVRVGESVNTDLDPPIEFGAGLSYSLRQPPRSYSFLRYSRVNAVRFFLPSRCISRVVEPTEVLESDTGLTLWSFVQRRHELLDSLVAHPEQFNSSLSAPAGPVSVDWSEVHCAFDHSMCSTPPSLPSSCGEGGLESTFLELNDLGYNQSQLNPIIQFGEVRTAPLDLGPPYYDFKNYTQEDHEDLLDSDPTHWAERWHVWRFYFLQAFYLAYKHGYTTFELMNEPEISFEPDGADAPEAFRERMVLIGDAVQRAIDTANRIRLSSLPELKPNILASAFVHGFANFSLGASHTGDTWLRLPYTAVDWWKNQYDVFEGAGNQWWNFYGYGKEVGWTEPDLFQTFSYHSYTWGNRPDAEKSHEGGFCKLCNKMSATRGVACAPSNQAAELPVYITEANLSTGGNALRSHWGSQTQDSLLNATEMSSLLHGYTRSNAQGVSIHKFENTVEQDGEDGELSEEALHGLYWYEVDTPSNGSVGGVTRAGEVARLFGQGFISPALRDPSTLLYDRSPISGLSYRSCLQDTSSPGYPYCNDTTGDPGILVEDRYFDSDSGTVTRDGHGRFEFSAAYNAHTDRYVLLSTNHHCAPAKARPNDFACTPPSGGGKYQCVPDAPPAALRCASGENTQQQLTIEFDDGLGLQNGTKVMIQEVSDGRRGEIRDFYPVTTSSNGKKSVVYHQHAQSVALISVPNLAGGERQCRKDIVTASDATVRGGHLMDDNFGSSQNLTVEENSLDTGNRKLVYIRMNLSGVDRSNIDMAALRLSARSGTSATEGATGQAIVHVYGLGTSTAWSESNLRWDNASNLDSSGGNRTALDTIGENVLLGVGETAHYLGSITGDPSEVKTERIDITDFLKSFTGSSITFVIVREVRFNPYQYNLDVVSQGSGRYRRAEDVSSGTPLAATLSLSPGDLAAGTTKLWIASKEYTSSDATDAPTIEIFGRFSSSSCPSGWQTP